MAYNDNLQANNQELRGILNTVRNLPTDGNTSDATATERDIIEGKTAYVNGQKITGTVQYITGDESAAFNSPKNYLTYSNGNIHHCTIVEKGRILCIDGDGNDPNITSSVSASKYGNALPSDVLEGKTFTSESGLCVVGTGTGTASSESRDSIIANPGSGQTSVTIVGLKGKPKWFVFTVLNNGLTTASGYSRATSIVFDGTNTYGNYLGSNLSYSDTAFSWSYDDGSLTISSVSTTNGGYMHASTDGYRLLYGYGSSDSSGGEEVPVTTVKTMTTNLASSSDSISFTELSGTPTSFSIVTGTQYTPSTSKKGVIAVTYDGNSTYGVYNRATGTYSPTHTIVANRENFSFTYSENTLTVTTDNADSAMFLTGVTYRLIYTY